MTITIYEDMEQGSDTWYEARCGLLTASEMKLIITPAKLQYANNDKERAHLYELAAQRVNKYVEPSYISDDMLRGKEDEILARALYEKKYSKKYGPVQQVGFITNDNHGFMLGYSPDGLVGDDGQIEVKSRKQKYQMETILSMEPPTEYYIQLQTGLLASERDWCHFLSYSGGMPMLKLEVYPDEAVQKAIIAAGQMFEAKMGEIIAKYGVTLAAEYMNLTPTERTIREEMTL